jgi:hypothetical protein
MPSTKRSGVRQEMLGEDLGRRQILRRRFPPREMAHLVLLAAVGKRSVLLGDGQLVSDPQWQVGIFIGSRQIAHFQRPRSVFHSATQ